MKKVIFTILFCSLLFSSLNPINGEEADATEMLNVDEEVQASDLEIKEPTLLPGHPFYFLKEWGHNIRLFFTFNSIEKAELKLKFVNEKLLELKKMTETDINNQVIEKAIQDYQERIRKVVTAIEKIKDESEDQEKVKNFSEKYTKQQILHQKILQRLEEQAPEQAVGKIKEAQEEHLEKFGEVLSKLEKSENIPELINQVLSNIEGSSLKEIKEVEILKEIKGVFSPEIQRRLEEKIEKRINNLKEKLEESSSEDQEKVKKYIEKSSGGTEIYLNLIDSFKDELIQDNLKELINSIGGMSLQEIKDRNIKIDSGQIENLMDKDEIQVKDLTVQEMIQILNELEKTDVESIQKQIEEMMDNILENQSNQ